MSYNTNIYINASKRINGRGRPCLILAMSYDSCQIKLPCLVGAMSYNSYQAEYGKAACLAVLMGNDWALLCLQVMIKGQYNTHILAMPRWAPGQWLSHAYGYMHCCANDDQEATPALHAIWPCLPVQAKVVGKPTPIMFIKAVIDEDNLLRDTPVSACICNTISHPAEPSN